MFFHIFTFWPFLIIFESKFGKNDGFWTKNGPKNGHFWTKLVPKVDAKMGTKIGAKIDTILTVLLTKYTANLIPNVPKWCQNGYKKWVKNGSNLGQKWSKCQKWQKSTNFDQNWPKMTPKIDTKNWWYYRQFIWQFDQNMAKNGQIWGQILQKWGF